MTGGKLIEANGDGGGSSVAWPAGVTPPPEFERAVEFASNDEGHLFVTGRAGTGKSTLLRTLRDHICLLYTSDAADE